MNATRHSYTITMAKQDIERLESQNMQLRGEVAQYMRDNIEDNERIESLSMRVKIMEQVLLLLLKTDNQKYIVDEIMGRLRG